MPLQIWLPLISDLHNQGVSSLVNASVQSGCSLSSDGKLGGCYKNTGTSANVAVPISFSSDCFSLCAWVRVDTRRNNWCRSFGLSGNGTYMGLGCEHTNGTSLGFHYYKTIDGTNTSVFDTYPLASDNGVWVHYVMCYDGLKYYIYKNGSLITSANANKQNIRAEMTVLYLFGGTSGSYSNHSLNDVRVYDECLSAKQVKLLSQGLVAHYTLGDRYLEGTTNLCNVQYLATSGNSTWGGHTYSKTAIDSTDAPIPCDTCTRVDITYSGSGGGGCGYAIKSGISATGSTTYTYSAYIKSTTDYTTRSVANILYIYEYNSSGTKITEYGVFNKSRMVSLGDGWYRCWGSLTTNSNTTELRIYFYVYPDMNAQYWIGCWQLEQKDHMTPYVLGTRNDTTVYDSSGYNYHGTRSGTLTVDSNTPRYSVSTKFASSSGSFNNPNITLSQFTFSFWAKHTAANKMLMGSNASLTSANTYWYWYGDNSFKYPSGEFYYAHNAGSAESLLGTWIHFVATYDGANITVYRNGVNEGSKSATGSMLLQYLSIGNGYNSSGYWAGGWVSDFRLYATALSAEDIKALYQVGASISKSKELFAYEFDEPYNGELMNVRYTASYNTHTELPIYSKINSAGEYYFDTNSSSAGTVYIPINPTGKTYYFDMLISVNAGNQFYVGWERYDKDFTPRNNNACTYVYTTKPTSDVVRQRYRGTVNLSTDGVNPCAYIALRILNGWSGTTSGVTGTATIHYLSLREVNTSVGFHTSFGKNGIATTDLFLEPNGNGDIEKTGIINMTKFVES